MPNQCPNCGTIVPSHSPRGLCPACLLADSDTVEETTPAEDASPGSDRFTAGTVLADRYRIVALLGRGGMGEVYRADDLTLGQPVALKFLLSARPEQLENLYREVRQARLVSDRHICRIHDIGEAEGRPFLSMELIEGEHLGSLLRRIGRLPVRKALDLARQLCAGMAAAHQQGLLHLDLKPSNLMINQGGDLVITDFGLSRFSSEDGDPLHRAGTPAYMAPEHLLEGKFSKLSDVFAVGLVFHEMFTGKRFHGGLTTEEIADWFRRERQSPTDSDQRPKLPPAVNKLISGCLHLDPAQRTRSVSELVTQLDELVDTSQSQTDLPTRSASSTGKTLAALLFTDIVGSVELQQSLGTEAYTRLIAAHDEIFKACLAESTGASILNETGDGFLVSFPDPTEATVAALRLQARLARENVEGHRIAVRIGLHMGLVTAMPESLRGESRAVGMSINLASRVMNLGEAGQILLTRPVYDDARQFIREHPESPDQPLRWISHGPYRFAGHDEPVEILEVGVEGLAPLRPPTGSGKATRAAEKPSRESVPSGEVAPEEVKSSDVYISYAPVDNRPLSPGQDGWISQFHRNLETRIEQLSGEPVKVVRCPPVDDDPSSEVLLAAVPQAKAMVSVVSPPFVKSPKCAKEAEVFWKSARDAGNLRLEDRTRLLKVVKTPVADADLPAPLNDVFSDLLSFDFFSIDPETGRMWEFDETFGVEARRQYYERVYDLSYELCHLLRAFQEGSSASPQARAAGKTVYLAETTGDLQDARARIKRELLERGHVVLPDRPLPLVGPQMDAAVRDCLERCAISIHLVGSVYGLVPEGSECSIIESQNRIAASLVNQQDGADALTRFIWIPRERPEPEARQAEFIARLGEDPDEQRGADLVEDSLEGFKEILLEELAPREEPSTAIPAPTDHTGTPRVYLICDAADEEQVEPLEDYLFEQGFEVSVPAFEGTESQIAAVHRQNLVHCDAALIYYGAASKGWVETKLMDLQQAPGYGRKQPILAKIVYIAPPFDRRKERFRSHQARVVRPDGDWDPQLLHTFVDELKTQTSNAR